MKSKAEFLASLDHAGIVRMLHSEAWNLDSHVQTYGGSPEVRGRSGRILELARELRRRGEQLKLPGL